MDGYYRPFKAEDYLEVLNMKLRNLDIEELEAGTGLDWRTALDYTIKTATKIWVIIYKGKIEGVFGLGELGDYCGVPWFVATNKFSQFSFKFAKQSREGIKMFLNEYSYLENYVYANHFIAKRWLKWLGFTIEEDCVWINNSPFQKFYMKKE